MTAIDGYEWKCEVYINGISTHNKEHMARVEGKPNSQHIWPIQLITYDIWMKKSILFDGLRLESFEFILY